MKNDMMLERSDIGSAINGYGTVGSYASSAFAIIAGKNNHAGASSCKGVVAAVSLDCTSGVTRTDGEVVAAAGDDDGDGDGDPDSDRAPLHIHQKSRYTETLQIALNRQRTTVSNRILRMAELKTRIGLSRSTIYEFQNSGHFPRSVSLGSRAVGWLESDIEAWMESRINVSKSA